MAATITKATKKTSDQVLLITRTFDAPIDLVFKEWTEPIDEMKMKGFTCPVCRIDLRPGGTYFYCMRSPEGKNYWGTGTYIEVIEPERIVCTDNFADENGNIVSPKSYGMSDDWPNEAIITVDFSEDAGKTILTLQHSPIKPGKERDMCRDGWSESLDKLADYLANENL
jgi:uncharacterized protein YndB with AHSA1/START domain